MQKYISTKQLYSSIKQVGDDVQNGDTYIVLKYSRPAYKITPLDNKTIKKHTIKDIEQFMFTGKKEEENLSTHYKKYLYS
jgi:hypothetical protein